MQGDKNKIEAWKISGAKQNAKRSESKKHNDNFGAIQGRKSTNWVQLGDTQLGQLKNAKKLLG